MTNKDAVILGDNDRNREFFQQRKDVWTNIVMQSDDQVRQRVAWFLSDVLAVSPEPFGFTKTTEMFATYYDIFVRNAL